MKKQKRNTNQNGITLIALITTIIVMLILSGVALSLRIEKKRNFKRSRKSERRNVDTRRKRKNRISNNGFSNQEIGRWKNN